MRVVAKPNALPGKTLVLCASNYEDPDLKKRILGAEADVEAASQRYDVDASRGILYTWMPSADGVSAVTRDEMCDLYEFKMARKGQPGRPVYNRIISLPAGGICPYCAHREVSTLDHYLSQKKFAILAVTPLNLVGSCTDCNKVKRARSSTKPEEQFIHPYFDDFFLDRWLYAKVEEGPPPALKFVASPPKHWSEVFAKRMTYHFDKLYLNSLYASQTAGELNNIAHTLIKLSRKGGPTEVKAYLEEQAESRRAYNINSWQTAMYEALAASPWFCNHGLHTIRPLNRGGATTA